MSGDSPEENDAQSLSPDNPEKNDAKSFSRDNREKTDAQSPKNRYCCCLPKHDKKCTIL